ncbi:MAG TPA: monovalent cation/H(+) antiporter subunit G [Kiritimatiellia bacterium]|nr:monovalent cation/H(+) antiporter subunit G [Kiritimatiellia bacterium]HMP34119.1 monovalent cation/H(+) antiporter subunit G [Kiritimatiellia bacterium]
MNALLDLFTVVMVFAGVFFFFAGSIGMLRLPTTLSRLHALTKADNLGLGLVVLGILPRVDGPLDGLKLVLVWFLVQVSAGTVSQLIAVLVRKQGEVEP